MNGLAAACPSFSSSGLTPADSMTCCCWASAVRRLRSLPSLLPPMSTRDRKNAISPTAPKMHPMRMICSFMWLHPHRCDLADRVQAHHLQTEGDAQHLLSGGPARELLGVLGVHK